MTTTFVLRAGLRCGAGEAQRLALLTLEEAHDLLRFLVTVVQEGGPLSTEAARLAEEIAVRVPSES
jgi:hypothetical protein